MPSLSKPLFYSLISGLLLLTSTAFAEISPDKAKSTAKRPPTAIMLALACSACHGINGMSMGPSLPNLAGQTRAALIAAMQAFKTGERPSTVMGPLAKAYRNEEITALAEYFATQKNDTHLQHHPDTHDTQQGRSLHETHCASCHSGTPPHQAVLQLFGQNRVYLELQMEDFVQGKRPMPKAMAEQLLPRSPEERKALILFYSHGQTTEARQ